MLDHNRPLDTRLRDMLRHRKRLRGIFNPIPSPAIVEMCAFAGFDFVIIDNEHGTGDWQATENQLRAARAACVPAIVRCLEHDIPRVLETGTSGILVPMVNTAAHAAQLVAKMKYPEPAAGGGVTSGRRGSAFSTRAAGYGAFGGPEHIRRSNEGIALLVQVETPLAVANAREIAAVDGVDGVFIGSNDLAHNMGHQNRSGDAPVQAAIEQALKAIAAAGKCPGIPGFSPEEEERYAAWGARCFAGGVTGIFMKALKEVASWPRPAE